MKTLIDPTAEQEPAVGSVITVHTRFESGGASSTYLMVRLDKGWSPSLSQNSYELRSWADLTDIAARNAALEKQRKEVRYGRCTVTVVHDAGTLQRIADITTNVLTEQLKDHDAIGLIIEALDGVTA